MTIMVARKREASSSDPAILLANAYYKPNFGGIENSLYYIGTSLKNLGFRPLIVASDRDAFNNRQLLLHEFLDDLEVFRYHRFRKPGILWTTLTGQDVVQAGRLIRKLVSKHRIVAVIARDHRVGLGASLALDRVPLVYVVPGVSKYQDAIAYQQTESLSLQRRLLASYVRRIILPQSHLMQGALVRRADQLVVLSENMEQQVIRVFPSAQTKISVLPPGVDTERFTPSPRKMALRQPLGMTEADFVCIGVGRLTPAKGFDLALKAIAQLPSFPNIKLLVVGDGPEASHLMQLARELGIADRVRFAGSTPQPESFYTVADVYLMSSVHEPFGQTILEAMASALPVVAFSDDAVSTATKEIVTHGENGFLCPFGIDHLAKAIIALYEMSPEERVRLGQNARSTVKARFSWMNFTNNLLNLMRIQP